MKKTDAASLSGGLALICGAGSVGLVALGIIFLCENLAASQLYGVPLSEGSGQAYVSAAAVRDVSLGGLGLAFTLLRDRRAVGLCALLGAIIPIGDGLIVMWNSATPMRFLPLHWGGAVVCLIFAFLLLRADKRTSGG